MGSSDFPAMFDDTRLLPPRTFSWQQNVTRFAFGFGHGLTEQLNRALKMAWNNSHMENINPYMYIYIYIYVYIYIYIIVSTIM